MREIPLSILIAFLRIHGFVKKNQLEIVLRNDKKISIKKILYIYIDKHLMFCNYLYPKNTSSGIPLTPNFKAH